MNREQFAEASWAGFMDFALKNDEARRQFEADTGISFPKPGSAIDAAIDKATGHTESIVLEFMKWATDRPWGWEHAPQAFRDAHEPEAKP